MSRRMSVSLTLDAVRERRKTVTRRHVDTWRTLTAGDRLTLIEKGMGLPKGAKQKVVAEVEVVDVRVEPLLAMKSGDGWSELKREGLWEAAMQGIRADPTLTPLAWFWRFWLRSHGYDIWAGPATLCRRIEWRYLSDDHSTPNASTVADAT